GVVSNIFPDQKEFKDLLLSGKRLRFYWGVDATAPTLHLSHAKNFILLEEFRKLGHEVIVLFGDFTARIGDPTDKSSTRAMLTKEDVVLNIKKWKELISPIISFKDSVNPALVKLNGEWLDKMDLNKFIELASNFSVQQMLERDMFQKRLSDEKPIQLHEFLYPLMQGYDSVAMDVDVECCGTDQTFNAMVGRTLQKRYNNKNKFVVAVNLMENPVTKELMSKSLGTGVFLGNSASEMYGAIMAQADEMTEVIYTNVTRLPLSDVEKLKSDPKNFKMIVAKDVVKIFFGEKYAEEAEKNWIETFSKGGVPDDIQIIKSVADMGLVDILVENKIVESRGEFRRLIDGGGVKKADGTQIKDPNVLVENETYKIGKRRFVKIEIEAVDAN
nr:tyrosine--tRNA ligase [Candidatus Paceibacterota bacterium]